MTKLVEEINKQDRSFYVHPDLVPCNSPTKGRFLQISGFVPQGTTILVDTAYAIVPSVESFHDALICSNLVCSRRVPQNAKGLRCSWKCSKDVIWCSTQCFTSDYARHQFECTWLRNKGSLLRQRESQYDFITLWHVVRLLAGRHLESKGTGDQEYEWQEGFERHWKSVEQCCDYLNSWPEEQIEHWKRLVDTYLSDSSLPCQLSRDDWLSILCKEETNTFGLYPGATGLPSTSKHSTLRGKSYGVSLYPRAAMFNHSCQPNVTHKADDQCRMVYTAARDIFPGEEVNITYFDLSQFKDVNDRQNHVQAQFRFKCDCNRCTEDSAQENMHDMIALPFDF